MRKAYCPGDSSTFCTPSLLLLVNTLDRTARGRQIMRRKTSKRSRKQTRSMRKETKKRSRRRIRFELER